MKTIWKSVIVPNSTSNDVFEVPFPARTGAKPICVMRQENDICVWFEVDPEEEEETESVLLCVGTGWGSVPENADYLGSAIGASSHVWHFYVPHGKKSSPPEKKKAETEKPSQKKAPAKAKGSSRTYR